MLRRRLRLIPEVALAWLVWLLLPFMPRRVILWMARSGGALAWRFGRRERKTSMANLDLVFGATLNVSEKAAVGRASFQSFALTLLDLFWFSRWTKSRCQRYVRGHETLMGYMRQSALIGVTGHIGNWEILSLLSGIQGTPATAVAMPLKNPFVNRMLYRLRIRTGSHPVPREGAVRSLMRTLRGDGVIGILLDQNTLPEEGGVFVPFFGIPVAVSNAAGLLAVKTGAPLVVVVAVPGPDGVYQVEVSSLFDPAGLTANQVTEAMTQQLEALIRLHPEHWLWSYKRWRYYRACDEVARYPFYAQLMAEEHEG